MSENMTAPSTPEPKRTRKRKIQPSPLGPPLDRGSSTNQVVEDGEEVQQQVLGSNRRTWSSITPPLGISVNEDRYGRVEQPCKQSGVLPDTISLKNRLQKKVASEGFKISVDSCEVMNRGVDAHLKKLIERCLGTVQSQGINKGMPGPAEPTRSISLRDFLFAMESNRAVEQSCQQSGVLPDTISLRDRVQKKLASQGLEISLDSCEALNRGVDVQLKKLIEPCLGIVQSQGINQVMPGPAEPTRSISIRDFEVAMESNRGVLGPNRSVLYETICNDASMKQLEETQSPED